MSRFTDPLRIEFTNDRSAVLLDELIWELDEKGSGRFVIVPAGFCSDGATVPRPLWWLMPAWGDKGTRAAILHDYFLSKIKRVPGRALRRGRSFADRQFYEAMIALGVARWRAWACYLGVSFYSTYYGWIGVYLERACV